MDLPLKIPESVLKIAVVREGLQSLSPQWQEEKSTIDT
jgi:hypothetical protein